MLFSICEARAKVGADIMRVTCGKRDMLHYHFVFISKYRKPVLRGDVANRLRELVREICRGSDIEILKGSVRPTHVHLLLSVPPQMARAE